MPYRIVVVAAVALTVAGCHFGHRHRHGGRSYTMSSGQIEYLVAATAAIEDDASQLKAEGKSDAEVLAVKCAAYDRHITKAPDEWASNFTSAKKVLKLDKTKTCKLAEKAKKQEDRAAAKAEHDAEYAKAMEGRRAAQAAQRELAADEEREMVECRAELQSRVGKYHGIECQVIQYKHLGEEFGAEFINTTASGTYVSVLAHCTNLRKRTQQVHSSTFGLVDGGGRVYEVDTQGSIYAKANLLDGKQRTPEFLDLHPGIETSIVCVFDVPESVLDDPDVKFIFGDGGFPLPCHE